MESKTRRALRMSSNKGRHSDDSRNDHQVHDLAPATTALLARGQNRTVSRAYQRDGSLYFPNRAFSAVCRQSCACAQIVGIARHKHGCVPSQVTNCMKYECFVVKECQLSRRIGANSEQTKILFRRLSSAQCSMSLNSSFHWGIVCFCFETNTPNTTQTHT